MVSLSVKKCRQNNYALTPRALKRLRLFSILALTGFPLFCIIEMFNLSDGFNKPLNAIIMTLLLASCIPLSGDRIYNRLYGRNRYLDERERETIQNAKNFSYKAVLIGHIFAIIVGLIVFTALGYDFQTPFFTIAGVILTLMNVAIFMLFLPITYIAWTQKPLPTED